MKIAPARGNGDDALYSTSGLPLVSAGASPNPIRSSPTTEDAGHPRYGTDSCSRVSTINRPRGNLVERMVRRKEIPCRPPTASGSILGSRGDFPREELSQIFPVYQSSGDRNLLRPLPRRREGEIARDIVLSSKVGSPFLPVGLPISPWTVRHYPERLERVSASASRRSSDPISAVSLHLDEPTIGSTRRHDMLLHPVELKDKGTPR
jgi:hypothetical protein